MSIGFLFLFILYVWDIGFYSLFMIIIFLFTFIYFNRQILQKPQKNLRSLTVCESFYIGWFLGFIYTYNKIGLGICDYFNTCPSPIKYIGVSLLGLLVTFLIVVFPIWRTFLKESNIFNNKILSLDFVKIDIKSILIIVVFILYSFDSLIKVGFINISSDFALTPLFQMIVIPVEIISFSAFLIGVPLILVIYSIRDKYEIKP